MSCDSRLQSITPKLTGAIVVVAKCPIPGKSKTRLAKLIGKDGSAHLAKSMLSDVLEAIGQCDDLDMIPKILLYAPGTKEGAQHMGKILASLHFSSFEIHQSSEISNSFQTLKRTKNTWILLPMRDSKSSANLTSSNLGDKLASALQETRSLLKSDTNSFLPGNTVFLGMDSPIIPLSEIIYSLSSNSKNKEEAHLCPAQDGGYGMISIPFSLPSNQVFQGVRWSNPLTAVSQMKALTDCIHKYCDTANTRCEISIKLGKMMHDIDEPEDIWELANLLVSERNQNKSIDKDGDFYSVAEKDLDALSELSVPAFHLKSTMSIGADDVLSCRHTFASFLKLGVTKSISMHEDDQIFSVCKETFEAKD